MANPSVPLKASLAYGSVGLPLSLLAVTFYVYLPKLYADEAAISLSLLGTIVLLSRVFDALLDPIMGWVSDRTLFRLGRRLPWMVVSVLPLGLTFAALSTPAWCPEWMSPAAWFTGWTFAFFLFWTMYSVPYESLGAELSFDFDERTRVLGFREAAFVLGTLLAAVFPALFAAGHAKSEKFFVLSFGYGAVLLITTWCAVLYVRERRWSAEQLSTSGFFRGLGAALENRPFRILLVSYTVSAFGAALPATLLLFYVEGVLQAGERSAELCLILYFLVGFAGVPFWIRYAQRAGKKRAWLTAMSINTFAFAGVFFLGAGDLQIYAVLVALSAIGYGGTMVLPSSMQADVIDFDELHSGARNEGRYVGLWSIAKKLSAALGAGLGLKLLGVTGYAAQQHNTPEAILALRSLYAALPCFCNIGAILLALRYPITKAEHIDIRRRIDARAGSRQNVAALTPMEQR